MTTPTPRLDPLPDDPDLGAAAQRLDGLGSRCTTADSAAIAALVVVETFPPNQAARLESALRRLGCNDPLGLLRGARRPELEARSGAGVPWWRLAVLTCTAAPPSRSAAHRRRVPAEFDEIEISAVRIGEGLCAVLATFHTGGVPARGSRARLHAAARRWFGTELPGFFAGNDEPQPLLELPATVPGTQVFDPVPGPGRTWTLSASGTGPVHADLGAADPGSGRVPARRAVRTVRDRLVSLTICEQLSVCHARYTDLRDHAHSRLGFVRIKHLEAQRDNLVSLSLTVGTTDRAVRAFNAHRRAGGDAVDRRLVADQYDMLDRLADADGFYRGLLGVSASLASSMQALRASRIARWIAVLSLIASLLLLSLADTATSPRIVAVIQWLTGG